jgi:hypothetical protein
MLAFGPVAPITNIIALRYSMFLAIFILHHNPIIPEFLEAAI